MAKGKWGESFLKSGLPLEHLTLMTLKSAGWRCRPHVEYQRPNREKEKAWFELDLEATHSEHNNDTFLSLIIECKYHDVSRFWFFLPHEADRWAFDDRVFNPGPLQTLANPHGRSTLDLAPCSASGIVVSEDGTKQDNAVHTAVQQLANGFVASCLAWQYSYNIDFNNFLGNPLDYVPDITCAVPVIVTNARLFRLNPAVTDLEVIRDAKSPDDVAVELCWTWHYNDTTMATLGQNVDMTEKHAEANPELVYRYPFVAERMRNLIDRPNWIAIINIKSLADVATQLHKHFMTLATSSSKDALKGRTTPRRSRNRKPT